jgi:crotonobetainyl-CoA:carnitine CoA-transferase CaiB-like acyl-CoA transferase
MKKDTPLQGVRVLDLGIFGVGPFSCSFLGRLGADVIRVERPGIDNTFYVYPQQQGASTIYIVINANKRSIILDLKTEEGRKIAICLAEKADVIIENHQPGVMSRLGLGYEEIHKINPRAIYVSSTGYGNRGPLASKPSADSYQQAMSGFAAITGSPGSSGEILRYSLHIDVFCALGICGSVLAGLHAREITGRGQKIETSQFAGALALQNSRISEYFATGANPEPMGSANPNIVPSQSFRAYDGKYINVSVPKEEYWPKLCQALGLHTLEKDPRFISNADRAKNRDELINFLQEVFLKEPARWWLILLRRHGVPCGPINTYDDIVNDPQLRENKMLFTVNTPWGQAMITGFPVNFSQTSITYTPTVVPGSNREEILREIGWDGEEKR